MINNFENNETAKKIYIDLKERTKEEIIDICTSQTLVILKREEEIERLNSIIKEVRENIKITVEIIKEQPSKDFNDDL